MANPLYPDVPQIPGVPPVYTIGGVDANGIPFLNGPETVVAAPKMTADAPGVAASSRVSWGIYAAGGKLALAIDSFVGIELGRESRVSDYPLAAGGFQSFNKVAMPGDDRVTVAKGGGVSDRQSFFIALDAMKNDLKMYDIVLPDVTISNRNLIHYEITRNRERGVTLLTVEMTFREIRQDAQAAFADTKAPSGASPVQNGPVQAVAPTPAQIPTAEPVNPSSNPALAAVGPITPDMTQPQRAAQVSQMIEAGATPGQLVTLGASFLRIPVAATASQGLTVQLGGQSVSLGLSQRAGGLFADIAVNGASVLGGVPALNDDALVRSAYLGFAGDLIFHDTQGGLGSVNYSDLASRVALLYAGA